MAVATSSHVEAPKFARVLLANVTFVLVIGLYSHDLYSHGLDRLAYMIMAYIVMALYSYVTISYCPTHVRITIGYCRTDTE